ncbi:protein obstructor-E-like [Nymphalis io]|uniref:protein obstructor-E-like n=1 Tax=Inachis io TaxID=171585 RepID=UPI0021672D7B|nr:protein obstructor-E-like [Nymphalis io]
MDYMFFRSPNDCQIYFICINGKTCRLSCGGFSAYDEFTESCVAAHEVSACPVELRNEAKRPKDAENVTEYPTTEEPFYQPGQFELIENETQNPEQNHIQIIINQNIRNFENSFTFSHLFLLTEPANPTADCAHQYGYFPSPVADPNDCGHYRICNAGRAIEMHCPTGLAFNPVTAQCDWPELVPTCDVETFVGYQCPPAAIDRNGNPVVTNHKYEGDCSAFYSCINGHARILSCDTGLAFNPVTSRCEDADRVQCEAKSIAKYY